MYASCIKFFINLKLVCLTRWIFKWNNPTFIFGTPHYHFQGYQDWKLVSQQYRAWSDCTEVQVGLELYLWQRQIT